MKILLSSHFFSPSVGGIETVSRLLAEKFVEAGHEVQVVTQTPYEGDEAFSFSVIRKPSVMTLIRLLVWSDVYFHNNISLTVAWPLLLIRRPWVVAHQTWIQRTDSAMAWQDYLKRRLIKLASNIAISQAIADAIPMKAELIGNPYEEQRFRVLPGLERSSELVFVGRLVSDKGVDLLLTALALLAKCGLRPRLTVVGGGPELSALQTQVKQLRLTPQVEFAGQRQGDELVEILNRHQILVVPSRWAEPFGLVALEGIACGCVVVGSERGGLTDAIGPCGLTFPNGDAQALAGRLEEVLTKAEMRAACLAGADAHLSRHTARAVAAQYIQVFKKVVGSSE